jgi:hypothetical protein
MSRDFEVEEGREVVRRTIVGGRPRAREKRRIRVPIGLEKVLCRAAGDPRFRAALLADRGAAVEASGFELLASERAVLDSVPVSVLGAMIGRIDVRRHGRGRFMRGVLAATFAATTTLAVQACDTAAQPAGITPDDAGFDVADVQQVMADVGVTVSDDVDPSRGISPDEPDVLVLPDFNADEGMRPDIVFGPDVFVEPDIMADGGVRPDFDIVDTAEAVPLGILPDTE